MPAIQTAYDERMGKATEGLIANMETKTLISRVVEGADGIGFGKVVVQGTEDLQVIAPTAGGTFRGVSVRSVVLDGVNGDKWPETEIASVMTEGVIWVKPSVAVAAGDSAYFAADGSITNTNTDNAIPGGMFDTSTAAGDELAKLRIA